MSSKMQTVSQENQPLFSNSFITCYADYLVIHLYYFPFGNKKIKYSNIRSCELRSADELDITSYKLWGMAFTPVWWPCDMKRFSRKNYILLDANQWPDIGLTMDDNELFTVYELIKRKMYGQPVGEKNPPPYSPTMSASFEKQMEAEKH